MVIIFAINTDYSCITYISWSRINYLSVILEISNSIKVFINSPAFLIICSECLHDYGYFPFNRIPKSPNIFINISGGLHIALNSQISDKNKHLKASKLS